MWYSWILRSQVVHLAPVLVGFLELPIINIEVIQLDHIEHPGGAVLGHRSRAFVVDIPADKHFKFLRLVHFARNRVTLPALKYCQLHY
jgi:hypothetical protein